ncbi:MAG TPA: endopeptidase La [Gemmatimonadaceae bacterium]|nr:endopeptidase La [Gemmatimonadaceae bacterium]
MPSFSVDGEPLVTAERLPVLPLRDVVLFPYIAMPLLVGRAASLAALEAANAEDRMVLLVAQRDPETQEPAAADLYRVGVVARVRQLSRLGTGTVRVLVEGLTRARVTRFVPGGECLRAQVEPMPALAVETSDDEVRLRRALSLFEEYVSLHRRLPAELVTLVHSADTPARQVFAMAAHLATRLDRRQGLLEIPDLPALLEALGGMLSSEIELLRLERKIDDDVRGSLFQNQREFYLQEQLKAIHRELSGDEGDDTDELAATLEQKGLPEPVLARARRELRRLKKLSAMSPESGVARTYLDWIAALPWSERTDDVLDVGHARLILDEDHYGLDDVKERVLDHIGVLSLVERLDGPILCLVGPPGVGKTSLGRSIARALGRKFVRMSLGGVRDEAEIRGHRRTYIGAMPGRVLQAMRRAEVVNPVILLDEIDKLGSDYRGDPAAALLEVLDPEQNKGFNDHYLEVDYDLSQVLFITTANSLSSIPEPLRDRMEIIRLAGYLDQEKYAIARQFLLPRQLRQHGLDPATVTLDADVLPAVVHRYTREAGVRELERRLARLARKLARARAERRSTYARDESAPERDHVTSAMLHDMLGTAPYDPSLNSTEDKVGVATGLAYTSVGGDVLEIEVSVVPGRGRLQLTGTLGDVMKESASAALSYARARAGALGLEREFLRTRDLHVHIPAGATPKDGPSAGIAIASAIVSALTGVPLRGDVAMTGEITLRGRVLPIGGLKEKSVAALRNRISHVIIPHENARDLDELPPEVKSGIHFHLVRSMDEVLALALARSLVARADDESPTLVAH